MPKDYATICFLLRKHNIVALPSERPHHQDDHIIIPFNEGQTASVDDFANFYFDALIMLFGKYERDDRVTSEGVLNERRRVNMAAYKPFENEEARIPKGWSPTRSK